MKQILSLAMVALVAASAWAIDVTFDFANNLKATGIATPRDGGRTALTTPVTYQGVTISGSANTYVYNDEDEIELRFGAANSTLTFSVDENYEITQITVDPSMPMYSSYISANVGEYTSGTKTWLGNEQSVTFTARTVAKFDKMVVTYEQKPTTAVSDLNANAQVAQVRYYNLQGSASEEPFAGLNIVVATMSDGTQRVSKVLK
ncbi:MAG: hypothetical protein IJ808_07085 [Muribaculaceae bacterium]|nr:hypothetical protein [Muribaculaceae bacterium]